MTLTSLNLFHLIEFNVSEGQVYSLYSHNFPSHYPNNAYVRWNFAAPTVSDRGNTFVYIEIDELSLDDGDVLRGTHGDSDVFLYSGYFRGSNHIFPVGYLVNETSMAIEFSSDSTNRAEGFSLKVTVTDLNGKSFYYSLYKNGISIKKSRYERCSKSMWKRNKCSFCFFVSF